VVSKRMRKVALPLLFALACCAGAGSQAAKQAVSVDVLVTGGTNLTMDGHRRAIQNGGIALRRHPHFLVGGAPLFPKGVMAKRKIHARGKLILPGLINGHTHAAMTLLRGLKDDVTLDEWLTKYIFPAEARNVNGEFVRWGTRLAALEMIRGGTTTF